MPDTGSPWNLPYPEGSDAPDVPGDMGALATAVSNALNTLKTQLAGAGPWQTLTQITSRLAGIDTKIADLYTKVPTAKIKYGSVTGTPSVNGDLTITHGAGWIPSHVQVSPSFGSSSNPHVNLTIDSRVNTATQIAVNCWDVKNDRAWTSSIKVYYTIRD